MDRQFREDHIGMPARKVGIAFAHGIVGNNRIFAPLLPLVPDGWAVREVELEGHGGDARDFSRASMSGWKRQVEECLDELARSCDVVLGVGHSMGCLLLLSAMAGAASGRVERLFLMNPPLRIRPRIRLLGNVLRVATGRAEGAAAAAAMDAYGVALDFNPLHYYGWPARYLELFAESRRARMHTLGRAQCHITATISLRDEMVSQASGQCFEGMANARVVKLPESSHFYFPEADLETLKREFMSFVRF